MRRLIYGSVLCASLGLSFPVVAQTSETELATNEPQDLSTASLGTRICRKGKVSYTIDILGLPDERFDPGILVAQLDGVSEDKKRLRFRVLGFDVPSRRDRKTKLVGIARMGDFTITPGTVYWDDLSNWQTCTLLE